MFTKDHIERIAGQYSAAVERRQDLNISAKFIEIDAALADTVSDSLVICA